MFNFYQCFNVFSFFYRNFPIEWNGIVNIVSKSNMWILYSYFVGYYLLYNCYLLLNKKYDFSCSFWSFMKTFSYINYRSTIAECPIYQYSLINRLIRILNVSTNCHRLLLYRWINHYRWTILWIIFFDWNFTQIG